MEVESREDSRGDPYSFYVVRVPEAVFSTDIDETLRVKYVVTWVGTSSQVYYSRTMFICGKCGSQLT